MHSLKSEFHELFEKSKYLGEGILNLMDWLNKAKLYYRNIAVLKKVRYALCPMPYALCPMPSRTSSF